MKHVALGVLMSVVSFAAGAADAPKVKVFILAGQSNMEGKAKVELMETQVKLKNPSVMPLYEPLRKGDKWVEREDVWVKFLDRKGNLTVGYGSPKCIGPELGFGTVVGDRYEQPVLLIKTAWGGRSLYKDFRPPSAGLPPQAQLDKMLADTNKNPKRKTPATMEEIKAPFGATYRAMLEEVNGTLGDLKAHFPQYAGQGYEIAGIVWFQGWNDLINPTATAEYAVNMAHFIRDVRRDLKSPNLPFVIAQVGFDGANPNKHVSDLKAAQAEAAALPEFKGNVALVKTDLYWDTEAEAVFKKGWRENLAEWNTVGSDFGYHYYGSPKFMLKAGDAMGRAMVELVAEKK
jgi:alpha-galactosidase